MKYVFTALVAAVAVMLLAAPATADWQPKYDSTGQTIINHKMHWPQLPDPNGWDIDMTNYVLADDWKCSETGMVDDIHFWVSVEHQTSPQPPLIRSIQVSIHDDVPKGPENPLPFSHPGNLLRQWIFEPTQYKIAGPWEGVQGWDDPQRGTDCIRPDHFWYWQVNIPKIGEMVTDPFRQEMGKIYWLDLRVQTEGPLVGWKTTLDKFNDDAVYAAAAGAGWQPVAVCGQDMPTDFAFVITPEPGTVAMLIGAGLIGLVAYARRRRKS
jgi:hypothetical protein